MIGIFIRDSDGHNGAYVATEAGLRFLMQHLLDREEMDTTLEPGEVTLLEDAVKKNLTMDEMVALLTPMVNHRHSCIHIGELAEYTNAAGGWWL